LDTFIDVKDSFNRFPRNPQKAQYFDRQHFFDGLAATPQRRNPAPRIRQVLHHHNFIILYSLIPTQHHPTGENQGALNFYSN
jgi:hypothetical protein